MAGQDVVPESCLTSGEETRNVGGDEPMENDRVLLGVNEGRKVSFANFPALLT